MVKKKKTYRVAIDVLPKGTGKKHTLHINIKSISLKNAKINARREVKETNRRERRSSVVYKLKWVKSK